MKYLHYNTREDCCKSEFGKIAGCKVFDVCRSTSRPTPRPTTSSPTISSRNPSAKSPKGRSGKASAKPSPRPITPLPSTCGTLWHRSQSHLNPDSCTNDKDVADNTSRLRLYKTVEDCCKSEFGKIAGCKVFDVCRSTSRPTPRPITSSPPISSRTPSAKSSKGRSGKASAKPSPRPITPSPSACGTLWHRSQSHLNPDSCTNDKDVGDDTSRLRLYNTAKDCCKSEFGKISGCKVFDVCRPTSHSSPRPTSRPSLRPITQKPDCDRPSPSPTDLQSHPPNEILRRTAAEHLNEFLLSTNVTERKVLRNLLEADFNSKDLKDIISRSNREVSTEVAFDISHSHQRSQDDVPEFVAFDLNETFKCKCVDCIDDKRCGGLWSGNSHLDEDTDDHDFVIHIVVSHCKSSLEWMDGFLRGYYTESIHVITKCGHPVIGAPDSAKILELPNVGRCDHSYAHYIANILPQLVNEEDQDDSIVVFLKDDISHENMHQSGEWSELEHLVRTASGDQGFSCGIKETEFNFNNHHFYLSSFHHTKTLAEFSMGEYFRNAKGYALDPTEFKSQFKTLGSWWASLGMQTEQHELTPVCYGGVFASSVSSIRKHKIDFWHEFEKSLSRGNNIQEGHYAERSWASLLRSSLQQFQVTALLEKSDGVYLNKSSMHGALLRLPKLYLHVGVTATSSTEILSNALIDYIPDLKSDGYRVAVHGKYVPDFPNIDRLASCMWSEITKLTFPDHLREAAICPENLLSNLSHFMNESLREHQDVIISNPWLSRRGTADSLSIFLHPSWDVHTIIYYRRYFEWITIVFDDWRQEISEQSFTPDSFPFSSYRYIDFIREYCKRLFYGKDVVEDGYPVRPMDYATSNRFLPGDNFSSSHYDSTSNFEVLDLTDLPDYSYFVAKEYSYHSRYHQHLTIVNYHARHSIETNFFCRVLHDAHNTCKAAYEREVSLPEHYEMQDFDFVQTFRSESPVHRTHALQDIAIAAFRAGKLRCDTNLSRQHFSAQVLLWVQMIQTAFEEYGGVSLSDLPLECLHKFEVERLLEVSLAYEKSLLPDFYESSTGARHLIEEFRKWRFCSIDTDEVLKNSRWDFLFIPSSSWTLKVM